MKQYAMSHGCKVNKNTRVEFNKTDEGELHIKIVTFGKKNVTLTEETFSDIQDAYKRYKDGDYESPEA